MFICYVMLCLNVMFICYVYCYVMFICCYVISYMLVMFICYVILYYRRESDLRSCEVCHVIDKVTDGSETTKETQNYFAGIIL